MQQHNIFTTLCLILGGIMIFFSLEETEYKRILMCSSESKNGSWIKIKLEKYQLFDAVNGLENYWVDVVNIKVKQWKSRDSMLK